MQKILFDKNLQIAIISNFLLVYLSQKLHVGYSIWVFNHTTVSYWIWQYGLPVDKIPNLEPKLEISLKIILNNKGLHKQIVSLVFTRLVVN